MEQKLKTLGILYIIYGALFFVYEMGALALLGHLGGIVGDIRGLPSWFCPQLSGLFDLSGPLMMYVMFVIFVFGAALIISGWGLYTRTNWGRIMALIMGVLCLFRIPLGTALGIYTLIVLTKPEAAQVTRR